MAQRAIYTVGGTVQAGGSGIYIPRKADQQLLELCRKSTFSYVLSPRQMGKSSLMVQTAGQLRREGVRAAIIDLQPIGTQASSEEWYLGLLTEVEDQLDLDADLLDWWEAHAHLGFVQRMTRFFSDVVLVEIQEPIVVFVDEIDTTIGLTFTDDFFIAIRYFYSARAQNPDFERLSFVLIGVATPGDLISDPQRTPFNVGTRVDLTDFTLAEARPLSAGLRFPAVDAKEVLSWVLSWTGGHPYLTQRLCQELVDTANAEKQRAQERAQEVPDFTKDMLDAVVASTFFGKMSDRDHNLQFVRDMLVRRAPDVYQVLTTYKDILREKTSIQDEDQSLIKSHLKLSGAVARKEGRSLQVRNNIYKHVFNEEWVKENLPVNWQKRIRNLQGTVAVSGLLLVMMVGATGWALQERRRAQKALAIVESTQNAFLNESVKVSELTPSQRELTEVLLDSPQEARSKDGDWQRYGKRLEIGLYSEETGDGFKAERQVKLAYDEARKAAEKLKRRRRKVSPEMLSTLNETATYYVWNLISYGNVEEAESVLKTAKSFSDDFKGEKTGDLTWSLAMLENVFSRLYLEKDNENEALNRQRSAVDFAREAAALEPKKFKYTRTLSVYLRNLSLTSEAFMSKEERQKYAKEGCEIAREASQLPEADENAANGLVNCTIDESYDQAPDVATANLLALREKLNNASSNFSDNIFHKLNRASLNARLMHIELDVNKKRDESKQYFDLAFFDWLEVVNSSDTFSYDSAESLKSVYMDLKHYIGAEEDTAKKEALFNSLSAAINQVVQRNSENPPDVALISAHSSLQLGQLQQESNPLQAMGYLTQSIDSFEKAGLLKDISTYSEQYAWACSAYSNRLILFVKHGNENEAKKDFQAIKDKCFPVFEKYDFDFYLHNEIRIAYRDMGKLLFKNGKFLEAKPLLEYTSKWGDKESSELLARIYRDGLDVSTNKIKADELIKLAGKQSMKRFTVPSDFGSSGTAPFDIYVYQKPEDYKYKGVDDQAKWLQEARGGTLPKDVTDSFRRLEQIAIENDVSFPELALHALENKNEENKDSE